MKILCSESAKYTLINLKRKKKKEERRKGGRKEGWKEGRKEEGEGV